MKLPNVGAGPVAAASVLTLAQSGGALGFSPDYKWLEGLVSPVDNRRAQGNAVAPPMMAVLARMLVECRVFVFAVDADALPPGLPAPSSRQNSWVVSRVEMGANRRWRS